MTARGREDRGQATVEFALVLPLLVVAAALLVHLGLTVRLQLQLEHAAREGARAAAVAPDAAAAEATAAVARSSADAFRTSVRVGSEFVEVRVEHSLAALPLVHGVGERTLSATVTMRREDLVE